MSSSMPAAAARPPRKSAPTTTPTKLRGELRDMPGAPLVVPAPAWSSGALRPKPGVDRSFHAARTSGSLVNVISLCVRRKNVSAEEPHEIEYDACFAARRHHAVARRLWGCARRRREPHVGRSPRANQVGHLAAPPTTRARRNHRRHSHAVRPRAKRRGAAAGRPRRRRSRPSAERWPLEDRRGTARRGASGGRGDSSTSRGRR